MREVLNFLSAHWGSILSVGGYVAAAAVTSMYPPSSEPSFYGWFYNFTHALLPVRQRPTLPKGDA